MVYPPGYVVFFLWGFKVFYFFVLICAQIILESFPVSSSGHVTLLENLIDFFNLGLPIELSRSETLSHFLHGPTAVVLAMFFWDKWTFLLRNIKKCWLYVLKIIGFAFIADFVTFLWYLFFGYINVLSFPVGVGFLISIFCLLSLRFCKKEKYCGLTWKKSLFIGICQGFALLPGVSRFVLTFVAGCWSGLSPRRSFEFSFAIQWPLIFAGFLEGVFKFYFGKFPQISPLIFNFYTFATIIFSSIVAFFGLCLVKKMVLENKLWYFSIFLSFSFVLWLVFVIIV